MEDDAAEDVNSDNVEIVSNTDVPNRCRAKSIVNDAARYFCVLHKFLPMP